MPERDLNDMIERTRRVMRAADGAEQGDADRGLPPGFGERVLAARRSAPADPLMLWQRVSYAGAGCAVAIALGVTVFGSRQAEPEMAASDPWLGMPMSSLSGDVEEGEQ